VAAFVAENWGWRLDPILWLGLGILTAALTLVAIPTRYGTTDGAHELLTPAVAGIFLAGVALAATVATSSILFGAVLLVVAAAAFALLRILRRQERYQGLDLRLLRSPGAWLVVISIILLSGSSLYFFTSLFMQYRFNDPVMVMALLLSLPELAALVGCFISGWAATRWGAPRTAAVAILIAGLATVGALTVGPVTPLVQPVLVLCLVAGPSAAAIGPLTQSLMDLAPPDGSSAPAAMRDALQSLGSNLGGIVSGAVGLIAFGRYATGALIDAGLDPARADKVAYDILDGVHVNEIARQPDIPAHVADLIAGSRLLLHTGQSVAYWGACLTAGLMLIVAAALMFRFARRFDRTTATVSSPLV
jgi:predicted MFS family arabinose efflux permease